MRTIRKLARQVAYFWFGVAAVLGAPGLAAAAPITPTFDQLLESMPENSWLKVSTNQFDASIWPDDSLLPYPYRAGGILRAWSSLAWDSTRAQLILWGGGHANYAGNEVYTWDAETGAWGRASMPSALRDIQNKFRNWLDSVTVDHPNTPQSSHTYDGNVYLPVLDRFVTFGGAAWKSGHGLLDANGYPTSGPFFWDPSKADPDKVGGADNTHVISPAYPTMEGGNMWENRDSLPAAFDKPPFTWNIRSHALVEDGRDVVYLLSVGSLWRYEPGDPGDPSQDVWTKIGLPVRGSVPFEGTASVDTDNNLFVTTKRLSTVSTSLLEVFDLNAVTPGKPVRGIEITPVDETGAPMTVDLGYFGMEYRAGTFYLWGSKQARPQVQSSEGATFLYAMDVPDDPVNDAWVMRLLTDGTVDSDSPVQRSMAGGILGKWNYVQEKDVFLGLADGSTGDIWAYKPENWLGGGGDGGGGGEVVDDGSFDTRLSIAGSVVVGDGSVSPWLQEPGSWANANLGVTSGGSDSVVPVAGVPDTDIVVSGALTHVGDGVFAGANGQAQFVFADADATSTAFTVPIQLVLTLQNTADADDPDAVAFDVTLRSSLFHSVIGQGTSAAAASDITITQTGLGEVFNSSIVSDSANGDSSNGIAQGTRGQPIVLGTTEDLLISVDPGEIVELIISYLGTGMSGDLSGFASLAANTGLRVAGVDARPLDFAFARLAAPVADSAAWADSAEPPVLLASFASLTPTAVPVPQTLGLLGFGLLWLVGVGRVSRRVARR